MPARRLAVFAAPIVAAATLATGPSLVVACADGAGGDVGDGGAEGEGESESQADDLGRPADCPASAAWVTAVTGRVVDEAGAPAADAVVQLCVRTHAGRLLCLRPAAAGGDGAFAYDVAENARCMERATARAVLPLAAAAALYCALPLSPTEPVVALNEPYAILATTRVAALPAEGDLDAARPVAFAGGDVVVDVVPASLPEGTYGRLAARLLDAVDDAPACLRQAAPPLSVLVGFSPELDVAGQGLGVRLPNRGGFAAGAAVPLYALGGIDCRRPDGTLVEEGQWERFADGVVSADGATIDLVIDDPADVGVPCLTWLGAGVP
ncbi:MAG: hypothetical protein FJ137_12525 [Deltaproteobacteria bacterium]|nr:hypothetical protein [Deltaproteobacteria bacterium]